MNHIHNHMKLLSKSLVLSLLIIGALSLNAEANNLNVANVNLGYRDPSANTLIVQFDVNWENSWRNKINHDALWLTVRLQNPSAVPANKKLCDMAVAGLNPTGFSTGSNSKLEIFIPADRKGAFLRRSSFSSVAPVTSQSVELKINYDSCGFSDSDQIYASVFGIEMVLVPEGSFYAGDYAASTAAFRQGSSDNDPWYVQSENVMTISDVVSNGYYYTSNNIIREDATGAAFILGQNYPKGYKAFYAMKYEITEGQWVEFLNALGNNAARLQRDVSNASHKNSDAVVSRNTVSCAGDPLVCASQRPSRAMSFLNWMDVAAFLDWAALRPMSELEFEKLARGPIVPLNGEYAWGTTDIVAAESLSVFSEDGSETVSTVNANANFGDVALTGGDANDGPQHQKGALRTGIFATPSATRESAGGSYYGAMEISGNLKEQVVTVANTAGRAYAGTHGDGYLTEASGFEGNANVSDWPGIDDVAARGITSALGSGLRGGSWQDASFKLRTSDRSEAVNSSTNAVATTGGRGVRTYDGI